MNARKENQNNQKNRTRMIWYGTAVVSVFILISLLLTFMAVRTHFAEQTQELKRQQEIQITSKQESFSLWLNALVDQGGRLINSDLFRLFSTEVAKLGTRVEVLFALGALDAVLPADISIKKDDSALVSQLPMMQNLLREFILYSDFLSGRVVNERAQVYLSSDKTPLPLLSEQKSIVQEVFSKNKVVFSPIKSSANGLVMDIYFPISSPYDEGDEKDKPVAVLIVSKIVHAEILKILDTTSASGMGYNLYIVQKIHSPEYIDASGTIQNIRNVPLDKSLITNIGFGERKSIASEENVFSTGSPIPNTNWILLEETPIALINAILFEQVEGLIIFAVLSTCIIILIFVVLWWYLLEREQRSLAEDFKALYLVIDEQQQVLNGINSSITDMIVLTDTQGIIQYVNKGFSTKMGKHAEAFLGLTMEEVFGFDTAKRITAHDTSILQRGEGYSFQDNIFIKSEKYTFQIIRTPYALGGGTSTGIVAVYRDITVMIETQEYTKKLLEQTVEALVQTIEMRDPYLAGHTRMMRNCVLGMGTVLKCSEDVKQTMQIATDLSQIGKLSIPKKILSKSTPLTEEEKACMEEHVEHSLRIISTIDFNLPIAKVIEQMNERVDGSGYPNHLEDKEIRFEAKVLAVANAFCALIKPRSYRSALSVANACNALEQQGGYAVEALQALRKFIETESGKEFLRNI